MPDPAGTSLMGVVARFDGVQRFTVLMRVVSQNGAVITKGWLVEGWSCWVQRPAPASPLRDSVSRPTSLSAAPILAPPAGLEPATR